MSILTLCLVAIALALFFSALYFAIFFPQHHQQIVGRVWKIMTDLGLAFLILLCCLLPIPFALIIYFSYYSATNPNSE